MSRIKFDYQVTIEKLSELFREHGYHGTSFSYIQEASGLGKGSLYHHFTNGKEDIARAVLTSVQEWFEKNVYTPLDSPESLVNDLDRMYEATIRFFREGNRVCVPGSFALHDARDLFPDEIERYFRRWIDSLSGFLIRHGLPGKEAKDTALETVALIQGGLVMGRAFKTPKIFVSILEKNKKQLKKRIKEIQIS